MVYHKQPATGQEGLAVHLHGRLPAELFAGEVGVVRGADVVLAQRLLHVLQICLH
jgi:hypothetical protein